MSNMMPKTFAILMTIALAGSGATLAYSDQAEENTAWQISGEVIETMNVASYTYLRVDSGKDQVWAAAPQLELAVGDHVKVPEGTLMTGYHSKSLDRTFDNIHFVAFVVVDKKANDNLAKEGHAHSKPNPADTAAVDLEGIEKLKGGVSIAQIFDERAELAGKSIAVRGKVVKFTPRIMGTNWLHLRDGSSSANNDNDLTVTTAATPKVGDIVVVRGVLELDKDFGAGYEYNVIIEKAEVSAE